MPIASSERGHMRNLILSSAMILISLAVAPAGGRCEDQQSPNALSQLQGNAVWTGASVSPALQEQWIASQKTGNGSRKVQCSIVLRGPATSADRAALQRSGFEVKSLEGTTGRGQMDIKDLPRVATNPIVKGIMLGTE